MAISQAWTDITTGQVDADSPINQILMDSIRDDLYHLKYWLGKDYTADDNHDHNGVNSKFAIPGDGWPLYSWSGEFGIGDTVWTTQAQPLWRFKMRAGMQSMRLVARGKCDSGSFDVRISVGGQVSAGANYNTSTYTWKDCGAADISGLTAGTWYNIYLQGKQNSATLVSVYGICALMG